MNRIKSKTAPLAFPVNRTQRRAANRKRAATVKALVIASLALGAGILYGSFGDRDADAATITASPEPVIIVTAAPNEAAPPPPLEHIEAAVPAPSEPNLLGAAIPLDMDTQKAIWEMCGENSALFCTVMTIAQMESRFTPDAVGDGGDSIGMMQINTYWQRDRITDLGVTDLTDIQQNVSVALDYIDWLANHMEPDAPESTYGTSGLFMAYNMGLAGARDAWESGITETSYSAQCLQRFQTFMAEMEVAG